MPEHAVVSDICTKATVFADKVGDSSYKSPEDPSEHARLVFHPECCARVDGNRQTVSFHHCPEDDPIFKPLPTYYTTPSKKKEGEEKNGKKKEKEKESPFICKSCNPIHEPPSYDPLTNTQVLPTSSDSTVKPPAEIINEMCITGPIYCITRGKETLWAIDTIVLRSGYGLEGHGFWIPTKMYKTIIAGNPVKRGAKSTAFSIPPQFSDGPPGVELKISIQAALIRPDWTFVFVDHNVMISFHVMAFRQKITREDLKPTSKLWPYLWSSRHGPDFVIEPDLALSALQKWRLSSAAKGDKKPIFLAIKETQTVFNGFGAQETCDLLFLAMIHPCMPVSDVCSSNEVWSRFEDQVRTFHPSRLKLLKPLPSTSSDRPFRMNDNGHTRFLALVLCYRRKQVNANQSFLDVLHSNNLLDSTAIIQPSGYAIKDLSLLPNPDIKPAPVKVRNHFTRLPNYLVVFPKGRTSTETVNAYTPIVAHPGPDWYKMSISAVDIDVKDERNKTTLGPYSFQVFVQAAWTVAKIKNSTTGQIPKGRRPVIVGSCCRMKRPLAADIKNTSQPPRKKAKKNFLEDQENTETLEPNTRTMRSGKKVRC